MSANQVVKRNISGMQVIKTLQLLLEDNYTMNELIQKLNENEQEPIFNNSVVSKYINTCRYCGIDIPKIHNRYFVAKLPFGLDLNSRDLELLETLQKFAQEKLTSRAYNIFNHFITVLNKYSNKNIIRVEKKSIETIQELYNKAVQEKRKVLLMFRGKVVIECIPVAIVDYKNKPSFKVVYHNKEKYIAIERISGLELLGKRFVVDDNIEREVVFKLTGGLAKRYTLREHEEMLTSHLPEYITISNCGENKEELISRLLRYDKDCEIIKPASYREEMKNILNKMLANYGE